MPRRGSLLPLAVFATAIHAHDTDTHPAFTAPETSIADFERLLHNDDDAQRRKLFLQTAVGTGTSKIPGEYDVTLRFRPWREDELGTEDWFNDASLPPQTGRLRVLAAQSSKIHRRRLGVEEGAIPRSLLSDDFAAHPSKLRVEFELGSKTFDVALRKNRVLVGEGALHTVDYGNGEVVREPMLEGNSNCFYQGDALEIKAGAEEEGVGLMGLGVGAECCGRLFEKLTLKSRKCRFDAYMRLI